MTNRFFPNLFSPLTLRHTTLPNRIVMLPIAPRLTSDGAPSDRDLRFYGARAEAGTGLIITGGTLADPAMQSRSRGLWEAGPARNVAAFRRLVDVVHDAGGHIFGQLLHPGREPLGEIEAPLVAPSAVASPTTTMIPHALTEDEIAGVVEVFVASAANLLAAGYDGIELHGAHGFLLGEFLSPHANQRQDDFGVDVDHGLPVASQIAHAIRSLSANAVLGIRISADEEIPGGLDPQRAEAVAAAIGRGGLFDYISVAVGINGTYVKDMATPQGVAVPLAGRIRAAAGLPVITSQRITQPAMAEEALRSGAADLIGMARAHIADAEWARHARRGAVSRIVPCIGCLQECRTPLGGGVRCVHNPVSGRESELGPLQPATRRKRVVVIGGGPAGMEAARIAAEREHTVILLEQQPALGGQVRLAAAAPNRGDMRGVVDFRVAELERLAVDVRLGVRATRDVVLAEQPDAVVVATGAQVVAADPDIVAVDACVTTVDVLLGDGGDVPLAERFGPISSVVVLDDGKGFWDSVGAAEFAAARSLDVTMITPSRQIAASLPAESIGPALERLAAAGVVVHTLASLQRIERGTVTIATPRRGSRDDPNSVDVAADLVVRTGPRRGADELLRGLHGAVAELQGIGDCLTPRRISHAVVEGHTAGRAL